MNKFNVVVTLLLLKVMAHCSYGFSTAGQHPFNPALERNSANYHVGTNYAISSAGIIGRSTVLNMGFFDGFSKAFENKEYKAQDERVRASHILIKGDDFEQVFGKIQQIKGELNERMLQAGEGSLQPIFAELARKESECSSATQGGDLGLFGRGKMVQEFDEALFPEEEGAIFPPVGSLVGPIVTDFGCHIILVTKREKNNDQVEEKLARND
jgi:peptidyl-prolyl cis-trans isomerase C